jgi:hypothetical protein
MGLYSGLMGLQHVISWIMNGIYPLVNIEKAIENGDL